MSCAVFAIYVHHLDPIALPISGAVALRWYGLAYLLGFIAGFLLLRNLAQRGLWVLKPEKTGDFIAAAALFGVFIGGRLGYVLFYHFPKVGWGNFLQDPLLLLRVWEGGMASHGGILGLAVFTWLYARKEKVSWASLADGLCVVGPLGLFFGRMANFINGELYGRVADGVAWAVKFPQALVDGNVPESQSFDAAAAAAAKVEPQLRELHLALVHAGPDDYFTVKSAYFEALLAANRHSPAVNQALEPFLLPRHPSQLYAGLLEGLLVFSILYLVRVKWKLAPPGFVTGLFFTLYAIFRIAGEQFREPDAAMVGMFTKGQFFSLFMFIFAAAFFTHAWRGRKTMA
jgi:phosphatidylglycerol---prolipoprotein diacylglyceryl transferase